MQFERKFKAAMFDFDGTITTPGVYAPTQEMANKLVDLAMEMPICFCTGRQLESFVDHGFTAMMAEIDRSKRQDFLNNLFLVGENGSVGYYFDSEKEDFVEFYQADWPSEFIERDHLMRELDDLIVDFGNIYYKKHRIVVVARTKMHTSADIEAINALSDKIYHICRRYLLGVAEDFEEYLHVGNSGIGVVICPADGDKDRGIREFAEILRNKRGIEIGGEAREIFVVGDQPQYAGNDHYFLKGLLGTPYTVGHVVEGADFPLTVKNGSGQRMVNDLGTQYLIDCVLGA